MPDWTAELRSRLAPLALTPTREAEIIEELSTHLDDRFAELSHTMPPADARQAAVADLDGDSVLAARMRMLRQSHAAHALPPPPGAPRRRWGSDLWMDIRYAARMLRLQPGLAAAAIVTLALGIGANTALFSLVHATLIRTFPVHDVDSLHIVHNGRPGNVFSYPAYRDVRDRNDVFSDLIAFGGIAASLNANAETDLLSGAIVTGNFFPTLGLTPHRGRLLGPDDDRTPMGHPVVVVSYGLWQTRFGGRADIVGHDVLLNGHRFTIVGVAPREFTGLQQGTVRDFYVPLMMQPLMRPPRAGYSGEMNPDLLNRRDNSWLYAIGRLKPGVTPEQADASLSTLAVALVDAQRPAGAPPRTGPPPRLPLTPLAVGDANQRTEMVSVARLLFGVVVIVLLVACANVANLLLSRAAARRAEIGLRLALGADRGRLVRQLLTESALLAIIGGAAGIGLAWLIAAGFEAAPPPAGALPVSLDFSLDRPVLAFALALSILTGLLFGLAPALSASRPRLLSNIRSTSGATGSGAAGVRWFHLRSLLVVAQVALCLALLVAAGLFLRSLQRAQSIDPGFDVERLVSVPLNVNLLRYTTTQGREFYGRAVEAAEALPGARAAAVARIGVLPGGGRTLTVSVEGRASSDNVFQSENLTAAIEVAPEVAAANVVGPGFFETLGLTLQQGRDFTTADVPDGQRVAIVNETFVTQKLSGASAIGRRISFRGADGPWHTIVGVVADSKYARLDEPPTPVVYLPLSQNHETGMTLIVRAERDPAGLVAPIRQAIRSLEPNLPITGARVGSEIVGASLYAERMGALLIGIFSGLALLLAAVGLYGVLSFSTARRTREMGIRLALGAEPGRVFRMVVGEGLLLVGAGTVIGAIGALTAGRFVASFLHGVSTRDAWTLVSVPVILIITAVAACAIPARRAMRVNPTVALRME